MNPDETIKNLQLKNRAILLKYYNYSSTKIKKSILEAAQRGNSISYLQKIEKDIEDEIIRLKKSFKVYSATSAEYSYLAGVRFQDYQTKQLKLLPEVVTEAFVFGAVNKEAVLKLAEATYKPLSQIATRIARDTKAYLKRENFETSQTALKALGKFVDQEVLRDIGLQASQGVVIGSDTWQQAVKKMGVEFQKQEITHIPYYNKQGDVIRMVKAEDYAKMVSRTTTAKTFREGAKDRILDTFADYGDLVEVLGISVYPNSPCIPYEGKVLSLEGKTEGYTTVAEAEAEGLFHVNCIHSFGVSQEVANIYGIEG